MGKDAAAIRAEFHSRLGRMARELGRELDPEGLPRGGMRYDENRRRGLPIMTSAVDSVIKTINRRGKGSEKFWSVPVAEVILQL